MAPSTPLLGFRDTSSVTSGSGRARMRLDPFKKPRAGDLKRKLKDEELEPHDLAARQYRREQNIARKARAEKARTRPRLIIGVDFGTTYSGVAYVSTADGNKEVEVLTDWSNGAGQSDILEKVPTRIAYASENPTLAENTWGYVMPGLRTQGWFKLLLDEMTIPEELDDPLLRQCAGAGLLQLPAGKSARQVTKDFLRFLYLHIMQAISTRIGELTLKQTPIAFHFTIPAVWSHSARDATRTAANEAGFESRLGDELSVVDEPEAAAFTILKIAQENGHGFDHLDSGSCVTVLDMGGGTVDLVSYRIARLNPLQLEEACVGNGAKCGGTTIDRALHRLLGQRFGDAFTGLPQSRIGLGSKFMAEFEAIKRDFDAVRPGEKFALHLKMRGLDEANAAALGYDLDEDEIQLSGEELAAMFDEVLTRTDKLVLGQYQDVKRTKKFMQVKHLILVGGASSPPYVLEHYRRFCHEILKGKVEVLRPQRAWSAICRGACMRGLEAVPVLHRLSRYHYGIRCHKRFESGKHREEDAFICPRYGKRAANQIEWPISKNEKLKPGEKKSIRCFYNIPDADDTGTFVLRETLYSCKGDEAPSHAAHHSVQTAGIMTVDLTKIVQKRLRELDSDDEETDKATLSARTEVEVEISMTMGSDKGVLLVASKVDRTQVGIAQIQYESTPCGRSSS